MLDMADQSEDPESVCKVHDPSFEKILGRAPTLKKILSEDTYPFAHEAGVFFPDTNKATGLVHPSQASFIDTIRKPLQ